MENNITPVKDPLGNKVHIPSQFDEVLSDTDYIDKDLSTIILKPTIVITLPEPDKQLYHLRSVDLGVTILLKSEWHDKHWTVKEYIFNPATKFVGKLMGMGEFVSFL